ncbi:MAG: hypothetical protein ABSG79_24580 [Bryobacteraceae bacterium]
MIISRGSLCSFLLWSVLVLLAPTVFAQSSVVRSGSLEVGPFLGASYGIDRFRVMGGGNVTYALMNRIVLPYFEVSYFPGLPHTSTDASGTVYSYSTGLTDVHGGVHIRLPWIFKEKPLVPYLVFGVGSLHASATTGTQTPQGLPSLPKSFPAATSLAVNGGGGLRYYLGGSGRFGFRVEAKVYKATSGDFSNATIGKVEAGFFFQIH